MRARVFCELLLYRSTFRANYEQNQMGRACCILRARVSLSKERGPWQGPALIERVSRPAFRQPTTL